MRSDAGVWWRRLMRAIDLLEVANADVAQAVPARGERAHPETADDREGRRHSDQRAHHPVASRGGHVASLRGALRRRDGAAVAFPLRFHGTARPLVG